MLPHAILVLILNRKFETSLEALKQVEACFSCSVNTSWDEKQTWHSIPKQKEGPHYRLFFFFFFQTKCCSGAPIVKLWVEDKTLWHATSKHICGRQLRNKIQPLQSARSQAKGCPMLSSKTCFQRLRWRRVLRKGVLHNCLLLNWVPKWFI